MSFTKGKWTARDNIIFANPTGYVSICTVHVKDNYEPITFIPKIDVEAEANARLIAAAPELLEALMECTKALYNAIEVPDANSTWLKAFAIISRIGTPQATEQ